MKLTSSLKVELGDGKKWRLVEGFKFYTSSIREDKVIFFKVEKGFETDFASIPTILMPFLKWRDKFNKASVAHDWLYNKKITTRKQADRVFLELMLALSIHPIKARIFYVLVRCFGWLYWKR
ncbi:MAG: DUF1353 domain-containing protein [Brevinematia bacterium]